MSSTPGHLGDLAASLVDRLPTFIEQTLKRELENSILADQCAELERRVRLVEESVELERRKQRQVRALLERVRGQAGKSGSVREFGAPLCSQDTNTKCRTAADDKENMTDVSFASQGSPVSMRTKRKGVIFPDDLHISKKVKLAPRDQ